MPRATEKKSRELLKYELTLVCSSIAGLKATANISVELENFPMVTAEMK